MNKLIIALYVLILLGVSQISKAEWVDTYVKADGTIVDGYLRSDADDDITNNYNTPTASELTDYYLDQQDNADE